MSILEHHVARGVMTITLNDVERRNALSHELLAGLLELCDTVDADPAIRVAVLTNRGSTFCAGANLKESSNRAESRPVPLELSTLFVRIRTSPKPWVGAIKGHCLGGGVGLAAVLDIAVALDIATFGFSEVRLGVAPAIISVVVLEKISVGDAREHFLRGNRFNARRAAAMGLVSHAAASDEIDGVVDDIVNDLLAGAPGALALAKQLTYEVPAMGTDEAFAWTTRVSSERFASGEAREGMAAFLEKRPASWVTRRHGTAE